MTDYRVADPTCDDCQDHPGRLTVCRRSPEEGEHVWLCDGCLEVHPDAVLLGTVYEAPILPWNEAVDGAR